MPGQKNNGTGSGKIVFVGESDLDKRIDLALDLERYGFELLFVSNVGGLSKASGTFESYCLSLYLGPNILRTCVSLIKLSRLMKKIEPDIVHCFDTKPGILCPLALGRRYTVSKTVTGMGRAWSNDSNNMTKWVYKKTQMIVGQYVSWTIFQNEQDKFDFESFGGSSRHYSSIISGSGVNTKVFQATAAQNAPEEFSRFTSTALVVICVSRLISKKGIIEFLDAARELRASSNQFEFVLVGDIEKQDSDGISENQLRSYAEWITWLPFQTDISRYLKAADITVLLSRYREGIPRVLLESGFVGNYLVTMDTPGCREVVFSEKNGSLLQEGTSNELVKVLLKLAKRGKGNLRESAIQSIPEFRDRFSLKKISEQYARLFCQLSESGSHV